MSVLAFVAAAMSLLSPGRDHAELAQAIASVVEAERPLFADDEDRRRTASLVVAIAFRESSFDNAAVSRTNDHCAMGINHRPDLAKFPTECIRTGFAMLRESMRVCPSHPIATYASGPRGCFNARAQRISKDRLALAARIVREVHP